MQRGELKYYKYIVVLNSVSDPEPEDWEAEIFVALDLNKRADDALWVLTRVLVYNGFDIIKQNTPTLLSEEQFMSLVLVDIPMICDKILDIKNPFEKSTIIYKDSFWQYLCKDDKTRIKLSNGVYPSCKSCGSISTSWENNCLDKFELEYHYTCGNCKNRIYIYFQETEDGKK